MRCGTGNQDRRFQLILGIHPNRLNQVNNLPMAYWNGDSGLHCLDTVVNSVLEDG